MQSSGGGGGSNNQNAAGSGSGSGGGSGGSGAGGQGLATEGAGGDSPYSSVPVGWSPDAYVPPAQPPAPPGPSLTDQIAAELALLQGLQNANTGNTPVPAAKSSNALIWVIVAGVGIGAYFLLRKRHEHGN